MKFFLKPCNITSNESFCMEIGRRGREIDPISITYKKEEIFGVFLVDLDVVKYFESSIRKGGNNFYKFELYSIDINEIVKKYNFPRVEKVKIDIKRRK